jgi:3'(2'), 5'-bisphosphate nucleotidase
MKIESLLIESALKAATEAASAIIKIYETGDFGAEAKADNSPLTLADKAAQQEIVKWLAPTNLPILSEEGKLISYAERKNWERFWLVDPLDGTKEFIKKNGEFTVNIALIENGNPVWGVVVAPALDKTYYINEEGRVVLIENGQTTILSNRIAPFDKTKPNLRVVASRSHMDVNTENFVRDLVTPIIVSMGSSLKFMMIAEGKADAYPRFAPTMEWDTAAAHAIMIALGYEVNQSDTSLPLAYNKENLLNPFFLVC